VRIVHYIANLLLTIFPWGARRALIVGFSIVLLLCLSGWTPTGKTPPAPQAQGSSVEAPPADSFEVLDLKKSQGVDLRTAGKRQVIWIDLKAGELLRFTFEQKNLDIEVAVFAPSGDLLFTVDSPSGAWGPEFVPLLGVQTGRYRLEITGTGPGVYRFFTGPKRQARDRDRQCALAADTYFRGKRFTNDGKALEAEYELQQSLGLWQKCGYLPGEANAAYKLGNAWKLSRSWDKALVAFSHALSIYRRLKLQRMQALLLNEIGLIYDNGLGQPGNASNAYEESFFIVQQFNFRDLEVLVLTNRCKLREERGDLSAAMQDAERALPLAKDINDLISQVKLENLTGRIYLLLGEGEEALRHHQRAQELLRGHPNPKLLASTLVHFGDAYRSLRNWNQAISSYLQGIDIWRQLGNANEEATALNNLGIVYSQTGKNEEGLDTLRRVHEIYLQLGNRAGAAVSSINLAWFLGPMGRYGEALGLYRESLAVFQEQGLRVDEAVAYFGMAWIERKRGNLNEARRLLEKALTIVESIRARAESRSLWAKFLVGWQDFYTLMVEILMEQHQREPVKGFDLQAFTASERARCRALLESVEGRIVLPSLSWTDLQRTLDRDTILLEYSLGEEKSFLWVVTSDSLSSYVLPGKTRIGDLAREIHQRLADSHQRKNFQVAVRRATELSQILFGQIARRLDRKRLLIVAPPELQYVSFAALPALPVTASGFGKWPTPWLDHFEIMVEPSATFLSTLRRLRTGRQRAPNLLAVVGAPEYPVPENGRQSNSKGERTFSPLRYSRKEALAIASRAKGRAVLFLGPAANPGLVLRGGLKAFQMLHFSAHGFPVSNDPQESAIVLSNYSVKGQERGNRLRARDIAKLDLPSELVVLSACSTGLGTEIRGEGLVGLTQAFFSAGASRIAASLWSVDDLGTSELMEQFYDNILQKKLSPSASLREAQLAMWRQKRWNSPYYWAGFVLQGEWR
jgi:CHAT domain-containing protein